MLFLAIGVSPVVPSLDSTRYRGDSLFSTEVVKNRLLQSYAVRHPCKASAVLFPTFTLPTILTGALLPLGGPGASGPAR